MLSIKKFDSHIKVLISYDIPKQKLPCFNADPSNRRYNLLQRLKRLVKFLLNYSYSFNQLKIHYLSFSIDLIIIT